MAEVRSIGSVAQRPKRLQNSWGASAYGYVDRSARLSVKKPPHDAGDNQWCCKSQRRITPEYPARKLRFRDLRSPDDSGLIIRHQPVSCVRQVVQI
jgi:hypothetical protein